MLSYLSIYQIKGKRVKKKRKRNNATGNQALKKPIQIKDLYLTLNMICTFFALQIYHIVLQSNMAALIEKKKRKTKKNQIKNVFK